MENPEPVREHHELDQLAGHFAGPERMHPSPWNPTAVKAEAVTDGRVALDGFAVVQDYEQTLEDGSRFAGHGVFRYDAPSDTYEMHWFDSTGGKPRIFRGGFADRMLVLTSHVDDRWQRLTYDFNLTGGYRFKMETSSDGEHWSLALEGDNFADAPSVAPAKRGSAGKKAATGKSVPKRAAGKKVAARKTAGRAAAKKTAARKTAAATAGTAKAGAGKAAARKGTARKAVAKKAGAKKKTAKVAARKAATKKTAARKTAAKKTAAGRTRAKKAGARTTVAAVERKRRQGKASKTLAGKKTAAKKATARGNGAAGKAVSQQKAKGAARRAPQLPAVRKTSTRTGRHRTAAKGAHMR